MIALTAPRGSHRRNGSRTPSVVINASLVIAGPGTGFGSAVAAILAPATGSGGGLPAQPVTAASNSAATAARDARRRAAAVFCLPTCRYQIIDRAAATG